ncbi:MAG: hypothetical protein KC910_09040 [Candidatus Eremiobacteraeota bacterium]|nr:hypothetical protein [Candidatus Eremiobacteraeota bacterium]
MLINNCSGPLSFRPSPRLPAVPPEPVLDTFTPSHDLAVVPTLVILPDLPAAPTRHRAEFLGQAPRPQRLYLDDAVHLNNARRHLEGCESVQLAASLKGIYSQRLVGRLPGFQDLRHLRETNQGRNNLCANFVSAILEKTQGLKGHYISVPRLETALTSQGWHPVARSQAQPGDVWLSDGHVELVSREGGTHTIGSNNLPGQPVQRVSERAKPAGRGRYYTRRTL